MSPRKSFEELCNPKPLYMGFSREFLETIVERFTGDSKRRGIGPTEDPTVLLYQHLMGSYDNIQTYLQSDNIKNTKMTEDERNLLDQLQQLSDMFKRDDQKFLRAVGYQ